MLENRRAFVRILTVAVACVCSAVVAQCVRGQSSGGKSPTIGAAPQRKPAVKVPLFSSERFLRAFRLNKEDVRHRALVEVERFHLQNPEVPDVLWEAIQNDLKSKRISDSLLRAVNLHGGLAGEKVAIQQTTLLATAPPPIVMVALGRLAEKKFVESLEGLARLSERPEFRGSYPLRHAVVAAAGQFEDRQAIELLLKIQSKFDGQLRFETSRRLASLTGEDFGGKPRDWQEWWTASQDQFSFAARRQKAANASANEPIAWDYDVPKFYGAPIYAKRVVFVIDHSGSMKSSVDGITRLEEAQRELEGAIKKLPEDAWLDIIAYNVELTPWQGKLMQAAPLAKSDAIRFATSQFPARRTAIYEALVEGITHEENLESILFLSDGDPTAGKIVDRPAIVQAITALNVFRRVAIDAIGIDARGPSEQFLRQLAAENFGTFRSIR